MGLKEVKAKREFVYTKVAGYQNPGVSLGIKRV
jgi:hypothetical protein